MHPRRLLPVLLAASLSVLGLATPRPAEALTLTYSERTQRVAPYFEFRGGYDLPFNLNISGYGAFAPDLSSFVNPLPDSASTGNLLTDEINRLVRWDTLADVNLNLGYRFRLFDLDAMIGRINASLVPYAGYRQFWTFTGTLDSQTNTAAGGLHYGARFNLGLPLGFSGFAYAEASTLLNGNYSQGGESQSLATNNTTLPGYGVGVNWSLPLLNMASVYAGYRGFFLPADLRQGPALSGDIELVHGLSIGASLLWFGI